MSFLNTLSQPERDTLRRVVKVVHMKHYPKDFVTDYETDKMIEAIGPEVAGRMIKVGIDSGINNK
jgi:isopentenyl diphosphate isomerase/L-lactate dehydrogenase-like FMN-dependent dehydrogenase